MTAMRPDAHPLTRDELRKEVLRLALHEIAYSTESDLAVYARFAQQTATDALLWNLIGSCTGCGAAIHYAADHPNGDECIYCTCGRYAPSVRP
jgi:hypothetical protein